jgi:hypothetical protein
VLLIAFGCAVLVYVILGFAMAILTSQMMALLQGDDAGARLETQSQPTLRWWGVQSMMGYHPLNPRIWFEIVRARDLPARARKKQREMRIAFAALIASFVILGVLLVARG